MYGDERIKKKKKERRQRVFPIVSLRRGTGRRSCRLLTAFFALRPALKESFSCRCCPLLETPRINCPPISHRVPSPPQQLNPILKHNKREKKYSPSEYYNEDNSIKRQSPLYIDLKSDLSRPINWNRLNSNIYERSAVNIERGACLIPLNDRPSLQWGVITKSRKRKGLGSKGVLITSVLSLRSFARKKKKIGYRSLEGDTLVTSFDHRPRHF